MLWLLCQSRGPAIRGVSVTPQALNQARQEKPASSTKS